MIIERVFLNAILLEEFLFIWKLVYYRFVLCPVFIFLVIPFYIVFQLKITKTILDACFIAQMMSEILEHKFLFPEYEIVIEPEELDSSDTIETEKDDLDTNEELAFAGNTRK